MRLEMVKVADLGTERQDPKWLVEGLWLDDAVGIIGGEPKSFKTFVALSLAVATVQVVLEGDSWKPRYIYDKQNNTLESIDDLVSRFNNIIETASDTKKTKNIKLWFQTAADINKLFVSNLDFQKELWSF